MESRKPHNKYHVELFERTPMFNILEYNSKWSYDSIYIINKYFYTLSQASHKKLFLWQMFQILLDP